MTDFIDLLEQEETHFEECGKPVISHNPESISVGINLDEDEHLPTIWDLANFYCAKAVDKINGQLTPNAERELGNPASMVMKYEAKNDIGIDIMFVVETSEQDHNEYYECGMTFSIRLRKKGMYSQKVDGSRRGIKKHSHEEILSELEEFTDDAVKAVRKASEIIEDAVAGWPTAAQKRFRKDSKMKKVMA
jgi:hypothetical protein